MITRRQILGCSVAAAVAAALPAKRADATLGFLGGSASGSVVQYNGMTPDYYISPTANPANDGTTNTGSMSAPWSINAINTQQAVYAGKIVGLMNGTYGLYDILGLPASGGASGWNLLGIRPASNTSSFTQATTIVAQTPLGAIIDGQREAIYTADPTLNWEEGLLGPATNGAFGDYGAGIIIDGIKFTGGNYRYITNYGGAYPAGRGGNGNNGCDSLTVRNCYFTNQSFITGPMNPGQNSCAVYSEGSYHIYVQNCRFDTINAPIDSGRTANIQFYSPTIDTIVENCTCTATSDGGNLVYWKCGPAPGHQSAVFQNNYLDCSAETNQGAPLMNDGCNVTTDTWIIRNNVFIAGAGSACIWLDNSGVNGYQGTIDIHDNTFVGDWHVRGVIYHNSTNLPTVVNYYNNIVNPSAGGEGGTYGEAYVPAISNIGSFNYNLYPTPTVNFGVGTGIGYTTLASWQSATSGGGHAADANSAQGNPMFVGSGSYAAQYQLAAGSPALTMSSTGGQIGAWNGASQIGSSV